MKKSLMVIVAFVLIFTHMIPPLNISFANEEVNECENMDFTVQTIIENDEKIGGRAQPSQKLEIEFKTKNKTEVINVGVNGKFEIKVDEEFLEINDVILISNDYFKIETKVASKESTSNSLQSEQYIECPVVEDTSDSEDVVTEEPDTEEPSESEDVVTEEPDTEEPSESEDVVTEEPDTKEPSESEDVVTEEPDTEEPSESEDVVTEELDTKEPSESEDVVTEEPDTEESSESEDVVTEESDTKEPSESEDVVTEEPDTKEPSESEDVVTEEPDTKEPSESEDVVAEEPDTEEPSESEGIASEGLGTEEATEPEDEVTEEPDTDETSNSEDIEPEEMGDEETPNSDNTASEKSDDMGSGDRIENNNTLSNILMIEPYQTGGLINVDLLNSAELKASHELLNDGNHEITLSYTGYSRAQLGLLDNVYTNFYLPKEIMEVISNEKLSANYEVPALGLLGLTIIKNEGSFNNSDIQIRDNHVSIEFSNLLSLNLSLLKDLEYNFTLKIKLENLPPTIDGKYNFYSTTSDELINVSLIPGSNIKSDTLENMPKLPEGTVAFHNVPSSITFNAESMDYTKGSIIIPRKNSDWSIDVLDTRTEGSQYSISAKAETPLTNTETQHSLPNALIYVNSEGEPKPLYSSDSDSTVKVHDGVTGSEEIIKNKWDADEGVLLEVNPYNVQPGTYATTINWTLTDGPTSE